MYMHRIGALGMLCQPSSCLGRSGWQPVFHGQLPQQRGEPAVPREC